MLKIKYGLLALALVAMACSHHGAEQKGAQGKDSSARSTPAVPGQPQAEEQGAFDKDKPYPIEKGIIEYKYTGDRMGTQVIYFTDYGRRQRIENQFETTNKALGHQRVNEVYISTPEMTYYIDMLQRNGYSRKVTDQNYEENLLADITRMGVDSTMRKNGYRAQGTQTVAHMRCQVYAGNSSKFCFNQGMNIKTEMQLGGTSYMLEAVHIKKNADVDSTLFMPPSDIPLPDYKVYEKKQTKDKL